MDIPDFGIPPQLARRMSMAEQHEYLRTKLTRRRTLVTAGSLAAGGLLAGCGGSGSPNSTPSTTSAPSPATSRLPGSAAVPFGRHLAFGGDPKKEMRISWQVPVAVRKPYVRVGLKPEELSRKIDAEIRDLHTPGVEGVRLELEQYYVHAALDGLRPGTTYYYGVGHEGFDPASPAHRSTIATFRTAPAAPETFVFTAFGDQGVGSAAAANDNLIARRKPAFHLHAGDICYANGNGKGVTSDGYDPGFWDLFLKQNEPVARSVPWMVTTGNHDMEAWYSPNGYGGEEARWNLPDNGPDPKNLPGVYSFVYGNTAVVSLDANDISFEIPANLGISGGTQTTWLEAQLKRFRASKDVDFVVVFFHHCAYCTSTAHASEGGVRQEWVPLFEKYSVDLVINGHNHQYERTDVIKAGAVTKKLPIGGTAYPETEGVVYVTAGAAGRSLYSFTAPLSYEGHENEVESVPSYINTKAGKQNETVTWSRVRYLDYSFLRVDVKPAPKGHWATLTVRGIAETGARVDHFTVARRAK